MGEIQIGTIIANKRREKGVTQEELANHIGVSKPAVSKWESGQSYPDILLLPVLAAYFDISIDELVGYEPQLTKQEVRKLVTGLEEKFMKEPFSLVYAECEEYLKKYFSCWEVQFQIALLLVNHCSLAGSPEEVTKILERALELLIRVEKGTPDVDMAKIAIHMQAACYLSLQKPEQAIELLEKFSVPIVSTESLIVRAYQMKGDKEKAMEYLQGFTYLNLLNLISSSTDFFMLYADNPEKTELFYGIFSGVCKLFEVDELHPALLINFYLTAARSYTAQGNKEKALDILELFTQYVLKIEKTELTLHGNRVFDVVDSYLKDKNQDTDTPRWPEAIWTDIKSRVLNDPAYQGLETEERFGKIKRKLGNV
jgi:transcriptional regulator with XRE-family HTH domain